MKRAYLAFIFLTITTVLPFCKKSSDIQGLIIGRWKIDSTQVVTSPYAYETVYKPEADYYEFTKDTLVVTWGGSPYGGIDYKIVSSNGKLLIQYPPNTSGGNPDTIMNLSDHFLILNTAHISVSKIFMTKQ